MYCKKCLEKKNSIDVQSNRNVIQNNVNNSIDNDTNNNINIDLEKISNINLNKYCATCGNLIKNKDEGCSFCRDNDFNSDDFRMRRDKLYSIKRAFVILTVVVCFFGLCSVGYGFLSFERSSSILFGDLNEGLTVVWCLFSLVLTFFCIVFMWVLYFIIINRIKLRKVILIIVLSIVSIYGFLGIRYIIYYLFG